MGCTYLSCICMVTSSTRQILCNRFPTVSIYKFLKNYSGLTLIRDAIENRIYQKTWKIVFPYQSKLIMNNNIQFTFNFGKCYNSVFIRQIKTIFYVCRYTWLIHVTDAVFFTLNGQATTRRSSHNFSPATRTTASVRRLKYLESSYITVQNCLHKLAELFKKVLILVLLVSIDGKKPRNNVWENSPIKVYWILHGFEVERGSLF